MAVFAGGFFQRYSVDRYFLSCLGRCSIAFAGVGEGKDTDGQKEKFFHGKNKVDVL